MRIVRFFNFTLLSSGSVLTKNNPPFEIWAGNPACKIGDVATSS